MRLLMLVCRPLSPEARAHALYAVANLLTCGSAMREALVSSSLPELLLPHLQVSREHDLFSC